MKYQSRYKSIVAAAGTISAFVVSLLLGLQSSGVVPQATDKQQVIVGGIIAVINVVISTFAAYNNPENKGRF